MTDAECLVCGGEGAELGDLGLHKTYYRCRACGAVWSVEQ